MNPARPHPWLVWQCSGVTIGVVALALAPPARGPMLLIPLDGRAATALNPALALDAHVLGHGRLPGSMVVEGSRAALWPALLTTGTLVTAALPMLCGDAAHGSERA